MKILLTGISSDAETKEGMRHIQEAINLDFVQLCDSRGLNNQVISARLQSRAIHLSIFVFH